MDAQRYLSIPDPSPAELVSVTSLIQQQIAWLQSQGLYFTLRGHDCSHVVENQVEPLDVINAERRYLSDALLHRLLVFLDDGS